MRYALEAALRPLGLTPPQWSVLVRLTEEDGLTMSDVGKRLGFDKPTMTGLAARLEEKGLLARRSSPSDGRVTHLHATAAGRSAVADAVPLAAQINRRAASCLSSGEQKELLRLLRKVGSEFEG